MSEYAGPASESPHHCRNSGSWSEQTQAVLDAAGSVAELDAAWMPLEDTGKVDSLGGAEYRHALAHLRHKLSGALSA